MTEPQGPRASREDRDAVAALLSHEFRAERLMPHEFDDRFFKAHAATHVAELEPLVADLLPQNMPFGSWLPAARLGELELLQRQPQDNVASARQAAASALVQVNAALEPSRAKRNQVRRFYLLAALVWVCFISASVYAHDLWLTLGWILGALFITMLRLAHIAGTRE